MMLRHQWATNRESGPKNPFLAVQMKMPFWWCAAYREMVGGPPKWATPTIPVSLGGPIHLGPPMTSKRGDEGGERETAERFTPAEPEAAAQWAGPGEPVARGAAAVPQDLGNVDHDTTGEVTMTESDDLLTLTAKTRDLALKCGANLQNWRRELAVDRLREALAALEEHPDRMSADGELLLRAPGANTASGFASQPEPEIDENAEGIPEAAPRQIGALRASGCPVRAARPLGRLTINHRRTIPCQRNPSTNPNRRPS